ncbi:MAG: choice-of-anchor X domain-containing protein, partial [Candidatus Edwardsbacteria bacterium]
DTKGPAIENVSVTYPSGQTAVRNTQSVTITALITDATTRVDTLTVRLDGTNLNGVNNIQMYDNGTNGDAVAGDNVYTAVVTITTGLNGAQNFTVSASDIVPNAGTAKTGSVILDNTAPGAVVVTVLDPDNIYHNGETIRLRATTDAAGYRVTADFSPIDNYYINGAETVQDSGMGVYFITYTLSEVNIRPNGTYTISVTATDGVGLTSTGTVNLVLDNSGPITSNLDFAIDPLNDNILNAADTLTAVVKDTNGVMAAEYFVDVIGPYGTGTAMTGATGADSVFVKGYFPISSLSEGQHTVYVRGKDSTNVWGNPASMIFTVDTKGPAIENVSVTYPSGQTAVRNTQSVTITALITDATTRVDTSTVRLDGTNLNGVNNIQMYDNGTNGDAVAGDNVYTAVVTVTNTTNGLVSFTISASDIVPNSSTRTGYVTLDNTPPRLKIVVSPLPAKGDSLNGEVYYSEVIVTGSYYDLPDTNTTSSIVIELRNQAGNNINDSPIILPPRSDRTFSRIIRLIEGWNKIRVSVNDKVGFSTSDSSRVTYIVPKVSQGVGDAGGTVKSPDGTTVVIPPKALLEKQTISIVPVPKTDLTLPADTLLRLIGVAHEFSPTGLVFHKPVEITLPYTEADLDPDQDGTLNWSETSLVAFYWNGFKWIRAGEPVRDSKNNTLTISVNHFTIYALGVDRRTTVKELQVFWTRNPFIPSEGTDCVFRLSEKGKVTLKVYDLAGDLVRTLIENRDFETSDAIRWDGKNDFDDYVGSGIYVYVFEFKGTTQSKTIKKPLGVIK